MAKEDFKKTAEISDDISRAVANAVYDRDPFSKLVEIFHLPIPKNPAQVRARALIPYEERKPEVIETEEKQPYLDAIVHARVTGSTEEAPEKFGLRSALDAIVKNQREVRIRETLREGEMDSNRIRNALTAGDAAPSAPTGVEIPRGPRRKNPLLEKTQLVELYKPERPDEKK